MKMKGSGHGHRPLRGGCSIDTLATRMLGSRPARGHVLLAIWTLAAAFGPRLVPSAAGLTS